MREAKRNPQVQKVHDSVIEEIAGTCINLDKYDVYTNTDDSKDCKVTSDDSKKVTYPDIVVSRKRSNKVYALYEIETEDSVNDREAQRQWKPYGFLTDRFILVIPKESFDDAFQAAIKHRVKVCNYGTYKIDLHGNIKLDVPGLE